MVVHFLCKLTDRAAVVEDGADVAQMVGDFVAVLAHAQAGADTVLGVVLSLNPHEQSS
jgi:hypothetical protein